jgi:hypothetical protein
MHVPGLSSESMSAPQGVWLKAPDWQGRAWLDGVEVSDRCAGVYMRGEVPFALRLWVVDSRQTELQWDRPEPMWEVLTAASHDIRVELRRP